MIFACYDCGAFFKKQSNKIEVNDAVEWQVVLKQIHLNSTNT
jgi:hypothetical protein